MSEEMSKEQAINYLKFWDDAIESRGDCEFSKARCALRMAIAALSAEPRTGHWRHGKHTATIYEGNKIISEQYSHWFCGSCGYLVKDYERPAWNYCPSCGAKMGELT